MKTDVLQLPLILGFLLSAGPIVDSFSASLEKLVPNRAQRLVSEYSETLPVYADPAPATALSRRVALQPEAGPAASTEKTEEAKPLGEPVVLAMRDTAIVKKRPTPEFKPVPRPVARPQAAAKMTPVPALPPLPAPERLPADLPVDGTRLDAGLQVQVALPVAETLQLVQQPIASLTQAAPPLVQTVTSNAPHLLQPATQTILPVLQSSLPPLSVAQVLPKPDLARLPLPAVKLPQPALQLPALSAVQVPLAQVPVPLLPRL